MDSGVRHDRDVLLCDRYAPCNHHRSMAVRPKRVVFLPRKGDTSCAQPRAGARRVSVVGFLTPCGHFIAELIDPCTRPTEADATRCVAANALCDIRPNQREVTKCRQQRHYLKNRQSAARTSGWRCADWLAGSASSLAPARTAPWGSRQPR